MAMLNGPAVHGTFFDRFRLVSLALGLHWIIPFLFGHLTAVMRIAFNSPCTVMVLAQKQIN